MRVRVRVRVRVRMRVRVRVRVRVCQRVCLCVFMRACLCVWRFFRHTDRDMKQKYTIASLIDLEHLNLNELQQYNFENCC